MTGPHFGEEGEQRFARALNDWCEVLRESAQNGAVAAARMQSARATFDRARLDYERSMQRVLGQGRECDGLEGPETTLRTYEESERQYKEAEIAYAEQRKPFEAAVAKARQTYEAERRKYTEAIEEVREQMDKAPEELRGRYDEILRKYQELCGEEHEEVVKAGGLFIVGTERHESRRIDNQLRGRAGRQGDPGASRFYLSLEDDLLRIFGADRIQGLMTRLGMEEGEPIEHRLITRAIANAQTKVEGHNFDVRKHLLEYDDVMNKQREVIYNQRREVLGGEGLKEQVLEMTDGLIEPLVDTYASDVLGSEWEWPALDDAVFKQFNMRLQLAEAEREEMTSARLGELLRERVRAAYAEREEGFTPQVMRQLEKFFMLQTIDQLWKDHLLAMDHLKEGIGLRGYGQRNPLQEYQKEGFAMFEDMIAHIHEDTVQKLFTVQVAREEELERLEARRRPQQMVMSGGGATASRPAKQTTMRREGSKVGRNDPCPCGSGKKYKRCHGA